MPSGLSYHNFLDTSISRRRCVWVVFLLPCFIEIPLLNANSVVDVDQMPCSAVSDLGLRCLPISRLWDARCKWVNVVLLLVNTWLKTQMVNTWLKTQTQSLHRNNRNTCFRRKSSKTDLYLIHIM